MSHFDFLSAARIDHCLFVCTLVAVGSSCGSHFSRDRGSPNKNMAAKSHAAKSKRRKFTVPSLSDIRDEQDHGGMSKKVVLFGQPKEEEPMQREETNKTGKTGAVVSEGDDQRSALLSRKISQRAGIVQLNQRAPAVGERGKGPALGGSTEHSTDVTPPSDDTEVETTSLQDVREDGPSVRPKSVSTVVGTVVSRKPHAIVVNPVQRANSVMKYIVNVPWELDDIVPDFILGRTTCAFFLRCGVV